MELSWQKLHEFEQKYGESFFILDLKQFENNYHNFLKAFSSIYPNTNLGYSYKTNYTPKLCKTVNSLGGYAEVVSQMEYELAILIGVHPSRIIFNGPLKFPEDIEKAILAGSIVNLDALREVFIIKDLAEKFPDQKISVGLRCNFDIGAGISRFGFDVGSGELEYAFNLLQSLENCFVEGLHCHFSTPQRSIESYTLRASKILSLSDLLFGDRLPKFLSLGGGFFGNMSEDLKKQFEWYIPSYQEYAQAIAPQFANHFNLGSCPELILEPGVAIVADVFKFACKVVGLKTVRSRQLALVTGSIHNVKPTLNNKNLSMKVYQANSSNGRNQQTGPVDLVGYTCMEHDCLYKDYPDAISVDDYVVFNNVGAYTIVFKPPFIRWNPAIVSYDSLSGKDELSRRRETSQDVLATYII